jgi:hypothetical protein
LIQRHIHVLFLAAAVLLASCGGGGPDSTPPSTAAAAAAALRAGAAAQQPQALAGTTQVDPEDAANQLMDYAETYLPAYFPSHPVSASALGYYYRFYPSTGIYLGVRDGQVYVLGGGFGIEVIAVGALTQFITPRPRVLSSLCAAGTAYGTFATPLPVQGKNVGITVAGCTGAIGSPRWVQTAGPAVLLAADKTQTVSFDPPQAGGYAFQVSFVDPTGGLRSENVALNVGSAATTAARVTVRASHSVRMGGKVSVRAWPTLPDGDSVRAVTWTQIEGPAVVLDTSTSRLALFTAPQVSRDTVIRLRATLYTANGLSDSDEVVVLVEQYAQAPATATEAVWGGDHVARVYPYVDNGPYSSVLRGCVYDAGQIHSGSGYNLCTLGQLPLLAQETGGNMPSVEQVMRRVLVSHDWVGRNFEAFLRTQDPQGDFRRMLNSVVAIVLSTEVRPSFYYAGTGAIYLDAESFWLTPEERDQISEAPDYRSDFGNGLQYTTLWRYVQDGRSIFAYFDPRARVTRTMTDVRNETAYLLYHELGHALDYIPPAAYAGLQNNLSVWSNISPRYQQYELTSDIVPATYPLRSSVMAGLGQVQYQGVTATAFQQSLTAAQVAAEFSADLATDDYAYSTQFEDVAMTMEELLMQRRLGIQREFAVTDAITSASTRSSIIVRWGQRGRVGEATIKPRAAMIAQALVPWLAASEVSQLPAPTQMRTGESWFATNSQPTSPRMARAPGTPPTLQEMWQFQREVQRVQNHRVGGGKRLPPVTGLLTRAPSPP